MKKLLFILTGIFVSLASLSQPCLPEGISFSTQAQIDSFQVNYPGCTEIQGNVTISGIDINNLNGLNVLTAFKGDLTISENDALTSLSGLENVISIGGQFSTNHYTLTISRCDGLTDLAGLDSLATVGGGIYLFYNQALTSLAGLENLSYIGGSLYIHNNSDLESLDALENLAAIGGSFIIEGNNDILSLAPLTGLTSISGGLYISYTHVSSLAGLEGLTFITGDVYIGGNGSMTSLAGLNNVSSIGGNLEIEGNHALTDFNGFDALTSIGGQLWVMNNWSLTSFSGLDNITSVGKDMLVFGNELYDFTGLESLASLGGGLYIHDNDVLTSLAGLDNIDPGSIINLYIYNNISLTTCHLQSICEYLASPNGAITIRDNATGCNNAPEIAEACGFTLQCLPFGNYNFLNQADIDNFMTNYSGCTEMMGNVYISGEDITNLEGLSSVTSVGKRLWIEASHQLTSLEGLSGLTQIGEHLWIENNNGLIDLAGLENLTQIGGYITIMANTSLAKLSGMDNIEPGTIIDITIWENSSLTYCAVESICDFIASPDISITFQQNAPGCNSLNEVFNACMTGLNEGDDPENQFSIIPNPSSTRIMIETLSSAPKFQISIFNLNGQEIISQQVTEHVKIIDISHLPGGVYFVRMTGEKTVAVEKFVKVD